MIEGTSQPVLACKFERFSEGHVLGGRVIENVMIRFMLFQTIALVTYKKVVEFQCFIHNFGIYDVQ